MRTNKASLTRLISTLMLTSLVCLASCSREAEKVPAPVSGAVVDITMTEQSLTKIRELYEKARQAGDTVPEDVMVWAKADAEKIGDWEYQITTVTQSADTDIQMQL